MRHYIHYTLLLLFLLSLISCSEDFMDKKPDKSLIVPTTLKELQSLLDNNVDAFNRDPALGFVGSDDYFIDDNAWQSLSTAKERNGYLWASEIYEGETVNDWNIPYVQIFYANVVLERLEKIKMDQSNENEWKQIKGSALFYRALAFYNLIQIFSPQYESGNPDQLGIPLRLTADIDAPVSRLHLKECFDQIIIDLTQARSLLPELPSYRTRPSKAATFAMMAKVFLSMNNYSKALEYADSCLAIQSALMNYNSIDFTKSIPVKQFNEEVIFHSQLISYGIRRVAFVNPELYQLYDNNDLRKKVFFATSTNGRYTFKGWYTGQDQLFGGLATDEIYLIKAECLARSGDKDKAMQTLNTLLKTRWINGTFTPVTATDQNEALKIIVTERRKELLFRGTRWTDIKRLNKEVERAKTLERSLNGQNYKLSPNDIRYVYAIPQNEIELTNISQNPR